MKRQEEQSEEEIKNSLEGKNKKELNKRAILIKALICSIIINFLWGVALKGRKKTILQQNEEIKVLQEMNKEQNKEIKKLQEVNNEQNEKIKKLQEMNKKQKEEIKQNQIEIEKKVDELMKKDKLLERTKKETTNRGSFISREKKSRRERIPQVYEVTMYTADEGAFPKDSPHYGTMTSGKKVYRGAVAVPRDIPFGSKIILKNLPKEWKYLETTFIAEDRGGAIKTKEIKLNDLELSKTFIDELKKYNQIFYKNEEPYVNVRCVDIYTPNIEEAINWGRRNIEGYLIRK